MGEKVWKKENSPRQERIWHLWRRIMKKLEWIHLKERKMKEKNTKEYERSRSIIPTNFLPTSIFTQLNIYNQTPYSKMQYSFSSLNLVCNCNIHILCHSHFLYLFLFIRNLFNQSIFKPRSLKLFFDITFCR